MGTNKFLACTSLVLFVCLQIANLFIKENSLTLSAIMMLCFAIIYMQLELLERINKTQDKQQDEPQTPPQRNLQGEPIVRRKKEISVTNDNLVDMAISVLRKIDMYAMGRRTENQLAEIRKNACDLLNATIAHRRQCKEAAKEFVETIKGK